MDDDMKRTTNRLNHYLGRPSSRHLHAQIPKTFASLLARESKVLLGEDGSSNGAHIVQEGKRSE